MNNEFKDLQNGQFKNNKLLTIYLNDIGRWPILTPEEELEIWKNMTPENHDRLVKGYLRLVVAIVSKIFHHPFIQEGAFMDLIQAGNIGLLRAIDLFDYKKGTKFSTYAHHWILHYVREELTSQKYGLLPKPARMVSELSVITKMEAILTTALMREPTDEELRTVLDGIYADNKIDELLKLRRQITLSLDAKYDTCGEEDEGTLGDYLADPNQSNPEDEFKEDLLEPLTEAIQKMLDPKLSLTLCARFGLGEFKDRGMKLEEIARMFYERGITKTVVTRERIRQLEDKALKRLRKNPEFINIFKNC